MSNTTNVFVEKFLWLYQKLSVFFLFLLKKKKKMLWVLVGRATMKHFKGEPHTVKNSRRFYGKDTGNWLRAPLPLIFTGTLELKFAGITS